MTTETAALVDQVAAIGTPVANGLDGVIPPTPAEIDEMIEEYNDAKRLHAAAKDLLEQHKGIAIFYADHWGAVPTQAKQSVRLEGKLHTLTVTRAETIAVNEAKVFELHSELGQGGFDGVFAKLFSSSTKHKLLEGASDFLRTVQLQQRVERKVLSLFGQCFTVETSSPSVRVELREAEKRATRFGGKAVA